jgi:hypothetical protein
MAVHVYGVVDAGGVLPSGVVGRADVRPRLVSDGGLAAIVSDVEPDVSAGRADLLAHAHLLEACAERQTVIPVQFGVLVSDDDDVRRELLDQQRSSLEALLRAFHGFQQLTVQSFHHESAALRAVLHRHPELAFLRDQIRDAPADTVQAERIELGQGIAVGLEELQQEDRSSLMGLLGPLAAAIAEEPTASSYEVFHAAFLVEREQRDAFDAVVGQIRQNHGDRLRIRYIGPQPPYAFLEAVQTGELAWA